MPILDSDRFEHRHLPPEPVPYSAARELLWQFLAIVSLVLGANYIRWRWTSSLNVEALWFAIPLAVAETLAYIGLLLFAFNLWQSRDIPMQPPPHTVGETMGGAGGVGERPITVDVFIATLDEDVERVRLSIQDARRVTYPHPLDLRVHVLDDGGRAAMRQVAQEEGVRYISGSGNMSSKSGNLRHAMEQGSGDFIVMVGADTRLFPTILANTLGYFRDPDVAWVQTPQWFHDLPPRNWCGASSGCAAGSIHRREAVMQVVLRDVGRSVVSGNIDTSSVLHDDRARRWKSVLHPRVESRMQSRPDLHTSMVHRMESVRGTLDIALRESRLFKGGMRLIDLTNFWSTLRCVWGIVFLAAPIVSLFSGVAPLSAYSGAFYIHALPFLVLTELAFMVGTWRVSSRGGGAGCLSLFPVDFRALWTVLRGEAAKFHLPSRERRRGTFLYLVYPQLAVVVLTLCGLAYAAWRVIVRGNESELAAAVVNAAWGLYNVVAMLPLLRAALWKPAAEPAAQTA